jgi:PAS domain-containing protein
VFSCTEPGDRRGINTAHSFLPFMAKTPVEGIAATAARAAYERLRQQAAAPDLPPADLRVLLAEALALLAEQQNGQRQPTEEARPAEDQYWALFNSLDESFCLLELLYDEQGRAIDYRFLEANPVFEQQTGLVGVVGKLGSDVTSGTEAYWLDTYAHVVESGEPVRFANYHAGTERWYEVYAAQAGGASSRQFSTVFKDITEHKQAAELDAFRVTLSDALLLLSYVSIMPVTPEVFALVTALPTPYLLLSPRFVIEAVSEAYLQATLTRREQIIGQVIFDAFPNNPRTPEANSVHNLRASLKQVLATGQPHQMAQQHYDVPDPESPGQFVERHWQPLNTPYWIHKARYSISSIRHRMSRLKCGFKLIYTTAKSLNKLPKRKSSSNGSGSRRCSCNCLPTQPPTTAPTMCISSSTRLTSAPFRTVPFSAGRFAKPCPSRRG